MATYYFDTNGTTAGFGTLTGNWNPSTALWSTSSAGTAATATVTFTNADVAQFGFTGTTGTAGTATITTGITNTVNQVVTANLAGLQTIAAGGTGTLNLAGTTPTINVGSAGGLTISAPITGTAGFIKAGAGLLTLTSTGNTLTGTVTLGGGGTTILGSHTSSGNVLPGDGVNPAPTIVIPAGSFHSINTNNSGYTNPNIYQGAGLGRSASFSVATPPSSSGVVYTAGQLAGMNGTTEPADKTTSATFPASGFGVQPTGSGVANVTATMTVADLPAFLNMYGAVQGTAATFCNVKYNGVLAGPQATKIWVFTTGVNVATSQYNFYANQPSGNPLVLTGGVERCGPTGTATFTLRGTNADDNTISGEIKQNGGFVLAISKADAGKWILSGANTYTGATSISAGTLSAQSASAFGSSLFGAVTQTGGTIDISGGVTLNKGTVAANTVGVSGSTALSSTSGNNEWIIGAVAMNSTTIVDIASGARLKLNNSGALSGVGFGITKNGTGEFELANTDNTFTGAVTVAAGTLTVTKLAGSGSTSSIGTGAGTSAISLTGTLKYIGTGHGTNRSITFTGASPALDASGTGTVTYSASTCTQAAGARTITFTGTAAAALNNTFSAALSDGTGAVSIAKMGPCKWILSNTTLNYTGSTTISDGTLDVSGANRTLTGGVSMSGGTLSSTGSVEANVAMTGGTITAQLVGNKTLDVDSGVATLQPSDNFNTFTGDTTIDAGATLRLITAATNISTTGGKVLGDSNVNVSGIIRTSGDTVQKGQMRYGGNLTFQANAKLYVGSLA